MTEDKQKLVQYLQDFEVAEQKAFELRGVIEGVRERCRRAIDEIQKGKAEVQARIDAAKEPKWIAAVSPEGEGRLILNLAPLSDCTKDILAAAINKNHKWVSFGKDGTIYSDDYASGVSNGLKRYLGTKIIFPIV